MTLYISEEVRFCMSASEMPLAQELLFISVVNCVIISIQSQHLIFKCLRETFCVFLVYKHLIKCFPVLWMMKRDNTWNIFVSVFSHRSSFIKGQPVVRGVRREGNLSSHPELDHYLLHDSDLH